MLRYNPNSFKDIAETELGGKIWDFLNTKDSIIRLEIATRLSHPAVEGVDEELFERFGDKVRDDRIKQTIGHMIRQIMEYYGYNIDQQNVACRFSKIFSRGSRYKKGGN